MCDSIFWLLVWGFGGLIGAMYSELFCKWQSYDIRWKRYLIVILCCGPIVWGVMTLIGIVVSLRFLIDRIKKWVDGGNFLTTSHSIIWLNFRARIGFPYKNKED